jgi:PII-like signaling protein
MQISGEAKLLRIFIGENDKAGSIPVYEKIVLEARESGLAGATVFKGIMGYGGRSRIHTAKILRLSEDMPLTIEIVDEENKIEAFVPKLNQIFEENNCGGLITIEKAQIIKYTVDKL